MIGNGSSLPITHIGNVHINTKSGPLVLSNVMHVLAMKKKLLSISQLTKDHDHIFEFTSKGFVSRPAGRVIACGSRQGGLYVLEQIRKLPCFEIDKWLLGKKCGTRDLDTARHKC